MGGLTGVLSTALPLSLKLDAPPVPSERDTSGTADDCVTRARLGPLVLDDGSHVATPSSLRRLMSRVSSGGRSRSSDDQRGRFLCDASLRGCSGSVGRGPLSTALPLSLRGDGATSMALTESLSRVAEVFDVDVARVGLGLEVLEDGSEVATMFVLRRFVSSAVSVSSGRRRFFGESGISDSVEMGALSTALPLSFGGESLLSPSRGRRRFFGESGFSDSVRMGVLSTDFPLSFGEESLSSSSTSVVEESDGSSAGESGTGCSGTMVLFILRFLISCSRSEETDRRRLLECAMVRSKKGGSGGEESGPW